MGKTKSKGQGGRRGDELADVDAGPQWVGAISKFCRKEWQDSQGARVAVDAKTLLASEVRRFRRISALRNRLLVLCGKGTATSKYPSLAFERWLLSAKTREMEKEDEDEEGNTDGQDGKEDNDQDPVIPIIGGVDPVLRQVMRSSASVLINLEWMRNADIESTKTAHDPHHHHPQDLLRIGYSEEASDRISLSLAASARQHTPAATTSIGTHVQVGCVRGLW